MASSIWKTIDLKKHSIPNEVLTKLSSVIVQEGLKTVDGCQVFYREAVPKQPSEISIVLLHGMRFSSKTWLDLKTIQMITAMGYRAVAIDVPGYGNSPTAALNDKATFLRDLLVTFNIKKPVIVSPSMSGFFTLPFLVKYPDALFGYVPVAPVGIEVLEGLPPAKDIAESSMHEPLKMFYTKPLPDLNFIKTPTMVVYGEKDRSRSSALLSLLPNAQCQEIPHGSHPAYLDNPNLWHKLLYNFLLELSNIY